MSDLKESEQCLHVAEIRKEENLSAVWRDQESFGDPDSTKNTILY